MQHINWTIWKLEWKRCTSITFKQPKKKIICMAHITVNHIAANNNWITEKYDLIKAHRYDSSEEILWNERHLGIPVSYIWNRHPPKWFISMEKLSLLIVIIWTNLAAFFILHSSGLWSWNSLKKVQGQVQIFLVPPLLSKTQLLVHCH